MIYSESFIIIIISVSAVTLHQQQQQRGRAGSPRHKGGKKWKLLGVSARNNITGTTTDQQQTSLQQVSQQWLGRMVIARESCTEWWYDVTSVMPGDDRRHHDSRLESQDCPPPAEPHCSPGQCLQRPGEHLQPGGVQVQPGDKERHLLLQWTLQLSGEAWDSFPSSWQNLFKVISTKFLRSF